ncbi:hypothetical protein BKP37_14725 [Anaerobacillus alkalilacustris]|uniref:Uncharacterized protein n=1 Tax=Anaerobacillus alkalilacustris TaxID=393763 RepID=A0A1S2LIH3_9BACI|nr:hypothetical protein [Anaerobacillus alkalilacustris]OIJ12030.1 hypothetical protein BKP37_14725 [Anaerobacillus alkalilacustris]
MTKEVQNYENEIIEELKGKLFDTTEEKEIRKYYTKLLIAKERLWIREQKDKDIKYDEKHKINNTGIERKNSLKT